MWLILDSETRTIFSIEHALTQAIRDSVFRNNWRFDPFRHLRILPSGKQIYLNCLADPSGFHFNAAANVLFGGPVPYRGPGLVRGDLNFYSTIDLDTAAEIRAELAEILE